MKKEKKTGGTKKIPKADLAQFIEFLDDYKKYIGLEGWKVQLKPEAREMGSALAEVEPNIFEKSLVIDRVGNTANAIKIADALGIDRKNIIEQINKNYFLDATIVIGNDFNTLKPNL